MPAKTKSAAKDSSATIGFEVRLWLTADKLRNNMDAAEPSGASQAASGNPDGERGGANQYKHLVLGPILLKYISDTFKEHRAILVRSPKSLEWSGFLLGHASSHELIQFTDLASTGTKMPLTNWSDISSFEVAPPRKPIAAVFTRNNHPRLDCIHANLYQSRTLASLRDTLLPKLLSGELKMPN